MDAKTLAKMTVTKLREEAMKFDDLKGVHGMKKPELVKILKQKYGISEEHHESLSLLDRKHVLKEKIQELKAERSQALEAKDRKKAAFLQKRLRDHRRLLQKIVRQLAEAE